MSSSFGQIGELVSSINKGFAGEPAGITYIVRNPDHTTDTTHAIARALAHERGIEEMRTEHGTVEGRTLEVLIERSLLTAAGVTVRRHDALQLDGSDEQWPIVQYQKLPSDYWIICHRPEMPYAAEDGYRSEDLLRGRPLF